MEIIRRAHFADTRLHYAYIGMNDIYRDTAAVATKLQL